MFDWLLLLAITQGRVRVGCKLHLFKANFASGLSHDLTTSGSIQYKSHMTPLLRQQYQGVRWTLWRVGRDHNGLCSRLKQLLGGGHNSCREDRLLPPMCLLCSPVPFHVNSQSTFIDCAETRGTFFCCKLIHLPFFVLLTLSLQGRLLFLYTSFDLPPFPHHMATLICIAFG